MSTLRVSNIEAKADPSSPSVDEKLKVTNSNGDVLVHIDGKTAGITTVGINTTDSSFTVDAAQNIKFIGIVTATKFSLSGGGEITGGDGNFTGIVTAGSIDATSATFSGNVSIGGTLTYEDVTSIDSIGIVTAQSDVHVGAGLSVVGISTLANTNINGQLTATNARITGVTTFGTSSTTINGAHEYPSIRPTLDLNFAATKTLDRRITFTRDSLGTFTDDMGIVKYASNNVPRFDHDPTTGESLGLLIEESRINYTYNSIISNASGVWHTSRGSFSNITTITSPDGTTDGLVLFTEDTQTGPHHMKTPVNAPTTTIADGTTVTSSIWVKKYGSKQYIQFGINKKSDSYARTIVDLDTGTLSGTPAGYTATSTAYPNGWYRIAVTGDGGTGSTRTAPVNSLFLIENGSSSDSSYAGDGSSGVYIWGPQMEIGSFATSFIPTRDSSTVTRATDSAKITGTNFTDFYNQSEGTVVCKYKKDHWPVAAGNNITYERIWEISDGTDATGLNIFNDISQPSGNDIRYRVRTSGTNVFGPLNVSTGSNQTPTVALGYAKDNFALVVDGTLGATDTSGDLPVVDRLHIGSDFLGANQNRFNNTISKLSYYPKRLPNAQLQGLTAQ